MASPLVDLVTPIGYLTVDTAPNESAQFPVLAFEERIEIIGEPGDAGGNRGTKITWTVESFMDTTSFAGIPVATLQGLITSQLAKRGKQVKINQLGTDRTLPAEGTSTGSLRGYPTCAIDFTAENSVGVLQFFRCTFETIVPVAQGAVNGFNLVHHTYTQSIDVNDQGEQTTKQSGEVRVRNDQSAASYIESEIFDAVRTAAEGDGRRFFTRVQTGNDAAIATYEYTDTEEDGSGSFGGGVISAEVVDRTSNTNNGRISRTVSGYAIGDSAQTFAADQEPTPGSGEVLTRKDISEPRIPDGRVDFTYELVVGLTVGAFDPVKVVSFSESIRELDRDRRIRVWESFDAPAEIRRATQAPFMYEQTSDLTFIGAFADAIISALMSTDAIVSDRILKSQSEHGVKRISRTIVYAFETEQTIPNPTELPAIS